MEVGVPIGLKFSMKKEIELVQKLIRAKGFPCRRGDMDFLLNRIGLELQEAKDETDLYFIKQELIDVLIQTIHALLATGLSPLNITELFDRKMKINRARDFSKHFETGIQNKEGYGKKIVSS